MTNATQSFTVPYHTSAGINESIHAVDGDFDEVYTWAAFWKFKSDPDSIGSLKPAYQETEDYCGRVTGRVTYFNSKEDAKKAVLNARKAA